MLFLLLLLLLMTTTTTSIIIIIIIIIITTATIIIIADPLINTGICKITNKINGTHIIADTRIVTDVLEIRNTYAVTSLCTLNISHFNCFKVFYLSLHSISGHIRTRQSPQLGIFLCKLIVVELVKMSSLVWNAKRTWNWTEGAEFVAMNVA